MLDFTEAASIERASSEPASAPWHCAHEEAYLWYSLSCHDDQAGVVFNAALNPLLDTDL